MPRKKKNSVRVVKARSAKRKSDRVDLRDGLQRSADFYGFRPRRIKSLDIEWPRAMVQIGKCSQVNYVSDKFDGILTEYYHKFKNPPLVLVGDKPQPDGSEVIVLIGKFKIKPEGIIG